MSDYIYDLYLKRRNVDDCGDAGMLLDINMDIGTEYWFK